MNSRYGIRLPHRLRVRSLRVLTIGLMMKFNSAGMLPIRIPMVRLLASCIFSSSGVSDGDTVSIIEKQKSPHSSQMKRFSSPRRV